MGLSYGQDITPLETFSRGVQLTADGFPKAKAGAVTVDWATVAAANAKAVTLPDGFVVPAGVKFIRYGTVLFKNASAAVPTGTSTGAYSPAILGTTLVKGETYLVNETILETDRYSNHPPAIDGGRIFKARLAAGGGATAVIGVDSDGANVTVSEVALASVEAALPNISYAID